MRYGSKSGNAQHERILAVEIGTPGISSQWVAYNQGYQTRAEHVLQSDTHSHSLKPALLGVSSVGQGIVADITVQWSCSDSDGEAKTRER